MRTHRAMTNRSRPRWATYERCFVLTCGAGFLALAGYIVVFESAGSSEWPTWTWSLLAGIVALGTGGLLAGIWGSARTVQRLARSGSSHEASLFITIVAAPLYFLLNLYRTRQ